MSDINKIKNDKILAMKQKDKSKSNILSSILAAIKQVEVDTRKEVDSTKLVSILEKMVKQRKESVKQFIEGGRNDLAKTEQNEIDVIKNYLPKQASEEEVKNVIDNVFKEYNPSSMKEMGKIMSAVKIHLGGRADMSKISIEIKKRLS